MSPVCLAKKCVYWFLGLLVMCLVGVSAAAQNPSEQIFLAADAGLVESVETFQFRFAADQERAIALSRNLRCPQCQNQNLIESNSPVAKDLRLKVYQMVDSGKTDAEVIEYMTSRFGDFVLYNPKFEPKTYFLWGGPVLLLVIFAAIAIYSIRRQEKNVTKVP